MENQNNQSQDAEYANILERTGIEEDVHSIDAVTLDLNEQKEVEAKPKEEPKEKEVKAEEAKTEPKPKEESKEEDEDQDDEEPVTSKRPISERPLKAIFSQMKEMRAEIAELRKSGTPADKAAAQVIDSTVTEIAKRRNLDPEGLTEILDAAEKKVLAKLESQGLLKKDLSPEIMEKFKVLDKIQEEQRIKAEEIHDEQDWISILPSLQKQYPNAPANLLADAKKVLIEIAHTKAFHDKDMDYIAFKSKEKLDAILKVAKSKKAGETGNKEYSPEDTGDEEEIDLDPENITPEKMKRYQARKYGLSKPNDDITVLG